MISLTDLAASRLQTMLQHRSMPEQGLRIFVQGGGCAGMQYGMTFEDTARTEDVVVAIKGVRLFVDPVSARYLDGACIDYQDTLMGSGFRVENPNATTACACGSSFRTEGGREIAETCAE